MAVRADVASLTVAQFIPQRRVVSVTQGAFRKLCPVCLVPLADLNTHVQIQHPVIWANWVGWLKDQRELNALYVLQDSRQ